jgi:hypothetical protein
MKLVGAEKQRQKHGRKRKGKKGRTIKKPNKKRGRK